MFQDIWNQYQKDKDKQDRSQKVLIIQYSNQCMFIIMPLSVVTVNEL